MVTQAIFADLITHKEEVDAVTQVRGEIAELLDIMYGVCEWRPDRVDTLFERLSLHFQIKFPFEKEFPYYVESPLKQHVDTPDYDWDDFLARESSYDDAEWATYGMQY